MEKYQPFYFYCIFFDEFWLSAQKKDIDITWDTIFHTCINTATESNTNGNKPYLSDIDKCQLNLAIWLDVPGPPGKVKLCTDVLPCAAYAPHFC